MNWTQIEAKWDQLKAKFQTEYAKLTDDDVAAMDGRRDQIVAKLRERYGEAKDAIEQRVDRFIAAL